MKKFILGLIAALILGIFVNITFGYIRSGHVKNPYLILGGLFKNQNGQKEVVDKDTKNCRDLISDASTFGDLKVIITGNGKPVENLEVDLSDKPGPKRCLQKTTKEGTVLFTNVPAGRMVIFFNSGSFPKELGKDPTVYVEIEKNQTVEKLLGFPYKQ